MLLYAPRAFFLLMVAVLLTMPVYSLPYIPFSYILRNNENSAPSPYEQRDLSDQQFAPLSAFDTRLDGFEDNIREENWLDDPELMQMALSRNRRFISPRYYNPFWRRLARND